MSEPPKPKKQGILWTRTTVGRDASAGYDLAANVFVGLGLGAVVQHFFSGVKPWGYVVGLLLGTASGFYQLFKNSNKQTKNTTKQD